MRQPSILLFATLSLLTAGCADDDVSGASTTSTLADTAGPAPVLEFGADWSVTQSAPLVPGLPATIHYDVDRLPKCRAFTHGFPAWEVLAHVATDAGPVRDIPMTELRGTDRVAVDRTIVVAAGHDLRLWFSISDEGGCSGWDSNFGRDFHFAIPAAPTIRFRKDWSRTVEGRIGAGGDFLVDYDLARLPDCRASFNGLQAWSLTMSYRFDGGAATTVPVTVDDGLAIRLGAPVWVHAPAGAREIEMWFENGDAHDCHAWDSDFGRNFHFRLE